MPVYQDFLSLALFFRWAILICSPGRLYCLADHIKIKSDQMPLVQPVVGSIWSSAFVEHSTAILQPLFTSKGLFKSIKIGFFLFNNPHHYLLSSLHWFVALDNMPK